MSSAIVVKHMFGRRYVLTRAPHEWDTDELRAGRFDREFAQRAADALGGIVVLLDQRRSVDGKLKRKANSGRRF